MKIYETFSPSQFTANPRMEADVKEHRRQTDGIPKFTILRQIVKAKVKSVYPPDWKFK